MRSPEVQVKYPFTLTFLDYPDSESQAILIHCVGCSNNCKECFNPELQENSCESTKSFSPSFLLVELFNTYVKEWNLDKVVLSGGDFLDTQEKREFLRQLFLYNSQNSKQLQITLYTGYSVEVVKSEGITGFSFLKCGKYDDTKKQLSEKTDMYIQFASSNQTLYDANFNLLSDNGRYYFKEFAV